VVRATATLNSAVTMTAMTQAIRARLVVADFRILPRFFSRNRRRL
jgi:hypothetical protein